MSKRYDEAVQVERDAGMPSVFVWRGRRYEVIDVIGRWKVEGGWSAHAATRSTGASRRGAARSGT